jgi:Ca-activated chloride channel homolog
MLDWLSLEWFTIDRFRSYHWENTYFLFGIIGIPILMWLRGVFHGRGQRLNMAFITKDAFSDWTTLLRWLFPISVFFGIALILVALARPQIVNKMTERDAEAIDIVVALDVSESMQEKDLFPNRLMAAKTVATNFIKNRLQDRIGLVIFAGEAFTLCPITNDYDLLYSFLDGINSQSITVAGTAIGNALAVSINRLRENKTRSKVIVLLSDGENTAGNLDPITAAKLAQAFGIKVYAIVVGLSKTNTVATDSTGAPAQSSSDEGTLQKIANTTNGEFFRATDNAALSRVFAQIDQLERVKIKIRNYQEVQDYYRIYLLWAIACLLFALFLKAIFVANVLED